jgi:hypothetical protein
MIISCRVLINTTSCKSNLPKHGNNIISSAVWIWILGLKELSFSIHVRDTSPRLLTLLKCQEVERKIENTTRNVKWRNLIGCWNWFLYIATVWKWFDEHSLNCWARMSGKHSLFLYALTNFDAISHTDVILSRTNDLKIWQGSVIPVARYDRGNV